MHYCSWSLLRFVWINYRSCMSSNPQCQIQLQKVVPTIPAPSFFSMRTHQSMQKYRILTMNHAKAAHKKYHLPRNREITSEWISVVDESGKMSGPHLTEKVLSDFDFHTKCLVTVVEGNVQDGRYPICKVMDRFTLRQNELAAAKAQKRKPQQVKELEISWAVEKHDLEIKLRRLTEFLMKGSRVNIILKTKRKGRDVTPEEGEELVKDILDVASTAGGELTRPQRGELLDSMELRLAPSRHGKAMAGKTRVELKNYEKETDELITEPENVKAEM